MAKKCIKITCKKCKKLEPKRYFIPLIGLMFLSFIKDVRNAIYLPIIIFLSSFILFWNFPKIVIFSTSKPTYFEDLFIDTENNISTNKIPVVIKKRIHNIYIWTLIVTSSVMISLLSDYWLTQYTEGDSFLTTVGTTGGVLKIYQMINKIFAKILLFFIQKNIVKQRKLYQKNLREKIELTSILNDEFKDICIGCNSSKEILDKVKKLNNKKINKSPEYSEIRLDRNLFDLEKGRRYMLL